MQPKLPLFSSELLWQQETLNMYDNKEISH